jgi:hypothetical protein
MSRSFNAGGKLSPTVGQQEMPESESGRRISLRELPRDAGGQCTFVQENPKGTSLSSIQTARPLSELPIVTGLLPHRDALGVEFRRK